MVYESVKTEASMSALLELGLSLGKYHEDIVLAGGWAPYFITRGHFNHCGSIDIDLVLRTDIVPKYTTIREILERLGYIPVAYHPFQFKRKVASPFDGSLCDIRLDMMCEKEGSGYIDVFSGCHDVQQDLPACVFEGLGLAFDFNFEQEVETFVPGNGVSRTTIKVVDMIGSMALKGKALSERISLKDSYDIFALTHFNGGSRQAAEYFSNTVSSKNISASKRKLLNDSIMTIATEFKDASRRGPYQVESFTEQKYSRQAVAAQVNDFLSRIRPWDD